MANKIGRAGITSWLTVAIDDTSPAEQANSPANLAALHFARFMRALGYDPFGDDEGMRETPVRVAEMYRELFTPEPFQPTLFDHEFGGMVVVRDIPFVSVCKHHFLPFRGRVHVGYIPGEEVIGLSKVARIVQWESARPNLQEGINRSVAMRLATLLGCPDVAVVVEARHDCMEIRGAKAVGATTVTSHLAGAFKENVHTRTEFMSMIGVGRG